jgi:hypothetical protein
MAGQVRLVGMRHAFRRKEVMCDSTITEPNNDVIAVHEAGHMIVGVLVGRRALQVSIDRINSKRGCFWDRAPDDWNDFGEMRIAGELLQARVHYDARCSAIPERRVFTSGLLLS